MAKQMRRLAATFAIFFLSSFPVLAADGVPVLNETNLSGGTSRCREP